MSVTRLHKIEGLKVLDGKVAVIYGAAGGVGTAVAKAFAREGATILRTGSNDISLNPVAQEISSTCGVADVSKVDALSPESVETHLHRVVTKTGKLDISFNLIGTSVAIGTKLTELSDQRFSDAAFKKVRSYFITMTAAARIMEKQGNGVILGLTAPNARLPRPNMGGFAVGVSEMEALCRQLAIEMVPRGVRYVCLRTGGTPDNPVLHAT